MPPFEFRGNGRDRGPHPKNEFTFRYPRLTAERPLLTRKRETTPEQLFSTASEKPVLKFAPSATLSDGEEAELDLSTDDDADSRPRKKRAFGLDGSEPAAPPPPAPKWSNPDFYTALPPPDESRSNKVDIVKLIRKAKIATNAKTNKADVVTANEDFISFGDMGDEEKFQSNAPENAPKGPRGMEARDSALSGRKRTRDDELKGYSRKLGRPVSKFCLDGSILDQWKALSSHSATPWMEHTPLALHMGTR